MAACQETPTCPTLAVSNDQISQLTQRLSELQKENEDLRQMAATQDHAADELSTMELKLRALKTTCRGGHVHIDTVETNLVHQLSLQGVQAKVKKMKALYKTGRVIRLRLMEFYRAYRSEGNHEYIEYGNEVAHGGNPITDLTLARQRGRVDEWCKIHGITADIPCWTVNRLLRTALQFHGTLQYDDLPDSFSRKFADGFSRFHTLVCHEVEKQKPFENGMFCYVSGLSQASLIAEWEKLKHEHEKIMAANKKHRARHREFNKLRDQGEWKAETSQKFKEWQKWWVAELESRKKPW